MAVKRVLLVLVLLCVLGVITACVPQLCQGRLPWGFGDGCAVVLDEETLDRLRLSMDPTVQMQAGETREFSLGVVECCYVFEPVDACATWSMDPGEGATIDPETGRFTVNPKTPSGEVFTVTADVEQGRRLVTVEVYVYSPEANPLVGIWREEAQFDCDTEEEAAPEDRIGELRFDADGTFSVTWYPFEIYRDYWGNYLFDAELGTLDLAIEGGSYVPADTDGSGSFVIDEEGRLVLTDIWLGSSHGGSGTVRCGHRFIR